MDTRIKEGLLEVLAEESETALNAAEYGNANTECRVTFKDDSEYLVRITIDQLKSKAGKEIG